MAPLTFDLPAALNGEQLRGELVAGGFPDAQVYVLPTEHGEVLAVAEAGDDPEPVAAVIASHVPSTARPPLDGMGRLLTLLAVHEVAPAAELAVMAGLTEADLAAEFHGWLAAAGK